MNIGTLLRKYRKEKKLTLKAVAEKAEISDGFLSQVENNVNSPSVDTLMRICSSLGIDPGDLIKRANSQENIILIRKSDWEEIEISNSGFATRRFYPPDERTTIDSSVLVIEPGRSIPIRKNIRNGQEILSVLKGSVELLLSRKSYSLAEGDSVHFWADPQSQKITNTGSITSIVLWVGTM
jgi:transcriptional regulator with XRE-family HTH domain